MNNRRFLVLTTLSVAAVVTGLGVARAENSPPGDIPDNQAFVTFRGAGYSLSVPEGWRRTPRVSGVTFADKYNAISVVISTMTKRPTVGSVTRTELRELRATTKGFARPRVTSVRRHAGRAVLVSYRATSAPSAVTGKTVINDVERYEFWRARKLAVLTLQAPHGSDNVDPWKVVSDSFAWTR